MRNTINKRIGFIRRGGGGISGYSTPRADLPSHDVEARWSSQQEQEAREQKGWGAQQKGRVEEHNESII